MKIQPDEVLVDAELLVGRVAVCATCGWSAHVTVSHTGRNYCWRHARQFRHVRRTVDVDHGGPRLRLMQQR